MLLSSPVLLHVQELLLLLMLVRLVHALQR
jgi:hypothetical protein